MWRRRLLAGALLLGVKVVAAPGADEFGAWVLDRGQVQILGHPTEKRLPAGSLQKPFVVRAWALSHPTAGSPKFMCTRTSGCWRPGGHGALDLRGAIRESCNTYFKLLSREASPEAIHTAFKDAGFSWSGEMTEAETIGLLGPAEAKVAPADLLRSYVNLIRTPWAERDDIRSEMRSGLMDAARQGTAAGLGLWGLMAKTGTVPTLDGAPLKTSGLAMVLDDSGFAFLGLLRRGTGREAAIRAGAEIARLRPGLMARPSMSKAPRARPVARKRALEDPVRVQMLDELGLIEVRLKNAGAGPVNSSRGFIGPGAVAPAAPGDRFSDGQWEIQARHPAFERRVRAAVEVARNEGPIRLIATMTARDYANGILKAELGPAPGILRTQLASAVLRYVVSGPRHPDADVCDSTHCAWFVGEGPVPRWLKPDSAANDRVMAADLSSEEWSQATARARDQPQGPQMWSADCGGEPVSPHFVWGGGDRQVTACPRHPKGSGRTWRRDWSSTDLSAIFGGSPQSIDVMLVSGQWTLRVTLASRLSPSGAPTRVAMTYDDAHRRLASRMGWDALPAPPSRVLRTPTGFVAEGVGFGHRVGLCLGR